MNAEPEQVHERSSVRAVCGVFALVLGILGLSMWGTNSAGMFLIGAANLGLIAWRYRPEHQVRYNASGWLLLVVALGCALPPLGLMYFFGDRPGWFQPLLLFFFVSVGCGPLLLLRRFKQPPKVVSAVSSSASPFIQE